MSGFLLTDLLLPVAAVGAGVLIGWWLQPEDRKKIKLFLAFSGAFLLSITVFNLMPAVFSDGQGKTYGIFVMLGILLQIFLEFFSKGAEHGHIHLHAEDKAFPLLLFISLSLHSFLEGFPVHGHHDVLFGVIVHKVPVAIILTGFFIRSQMSRTKSILFMMLFSLMTPLGTLLAHLIELPEHVYRAITALVLGIFLHISTVILFESSEGHKFNFSKLMVIVLGIITAFMI
ncbi:ZIP family metal transporter [Robertkochia aurantiaca]|uniref:ZIP family metal transporter n=1 Tax=Robertkochia aurantiaca TaxID=2873700 RepID=UPI001CCA28F0|nr:ZIP family metal transporter [Robertkochia sp. 3YJGBD-33]